jgi:molybdate transport system regulatory protein
VKFTKAVLHGRYWLIFLFLRYTGARLSEVLSTDESRDIDFRNSEVTLLTLKKHKKRKKTQYKRIIPIPESVLNEYLRFINIHPEVRGHVFKISRVSFFKLFQKMAVEQGIPKNLAHPHILRHTRAIELLRGGVPVTIVQQLLGHTSLSTTAIYLRYSATESKSILKEKGFI